MMEHHPLKCSVPRLQRQLNAGSFQLQNAATERENNTSFPKQFQTHRFHQQQNDTLGHPTRLSGKSPIAY